MSQVQDIGAIINIIDETPYTNISKFETFEDDTIGETSLVYFTKEFRFSKDNSQWSSFMSLNDTNIQAVEVLDSTDIFYFQYKYTLTGNNPNFDLISVSMVNIMYATITDNDPYKHLRNVNLSTPNSCSCTVDNSNIDSQYFNNFQNILSCDNDSVFDFYKVNKNLQQEISSTINKTFGHDAKYFCAIPFSNDIILKQWTLSKVDEGKCLKVLVPNNEFPDSMLKFDPFGITFETTFEIHIDKKYFHELFGLTKEPQKGDIIYFTDLNINRIYEVHSSYLFNTYNGNPLYYKLSLIKYEPKLARDESELDGELDDLTLSFDEIFADKRKEIFDKKTKPLQYSLDNINRVLLDSSMISDSPLINGNILVSRNYYNLCNTLSYDNKKVEYKPNLELLDTNNMSINFWFKRVKNFRNSNLIFGTDMDLGMKVFYNDNGFDVKLMDNDYTFDDYLIEDDKWYAIVLNVGNTVNEISLGISEMVGTQSAMNNVVFKQSLPLVKTTISNVDTLAFYSSEFHVTNLRVFDTILNEEHWNTVLNQFIVKDSQRLIIADNMQTTFSIQKFTKPL